MTPRQRVYSDVALFAGKSPSKLADTSVLSNIGLDQTGLRLLAQSLRSYVRWKKPTRTLLVAEISKDPFTIGELVALIENKVGP